LAREAASLLSRRDAEIDRLTSTQDILKIRLDNCLHFAEENVEFKKENRDLLLRLKQCDTEIESIKIALEVSIAKLGDARVELQKAESEIDRLKGMVSQNEGVLPQYEALVRDEAIKEFADRLKEIDDYVSPLDIDNLVKEMTEETS
jgi:chromosome segregation ATPase